MKLSFLGLGTMGYPMAGHQAKSGFDLCVYNRTTAKAEAWVQEYSGRFTASPELAVDGADIVMSCLGNDQDVVEVLLKPAFLGALKPGAIVVDHTTTSAKLARQLASAFEDIGVHFIDAPVSGGQAGAKNGVLTVMAGGEAEILAKAEPAMQPYAKSITLMGAVGSGQTAKMVNQVMIAGILQGLSEGLTLATHSGLDVDKVITALSGGAAGSWQLLNRAKTMVEGKFDFGFAIDWMRKDLGFCLDQAKELGLTLPNAAAVDERYAKLQAQGCGRLDTSVLIKAINSQ